MSTNSQSSDIRYERPETVDNARDLLDQYGNDAKLTAGGQSLMLLLRQGLLDPDIIVDISEIPPLNGIEIDDGRVRIGAATTYETLGEHQLSSRFSALKDAVKVIADPQVRNMGTIGGAVGHADPSLDLIPNLLCLDASVHVGSVDGKRTIPLSEFCHGYMETDLNRNELVEAISFSDDADEWGSDYTKHSNIKGGWATVGAASRIRLSDSGRCENVRVGLTAVAETAIRSSAVEDALTGEVIDEEQLSSAAEAVIEDTAPLDDLSGSAAYKDDLAVTLTKRSLRTATERTGGSL